MRPRFAAAAIAPLLTLALSGCLGPFNPTDGPQVEIRPARPSGEKLTFPSLPASTFLDAGRWPDACKLVADAEVTAILPQARSITRTAYSGDITYGQLALRDQPIKVSDGRRARPVFDDVGKAHNSECEYSMKLPVKKRSADAGRNSAGLTIKVVAVGHPQLLADILVERRGHERTFRELGSQLDAEDCFSAGRSGVTCRKGQLLFTVNSHSYVSPSINLKDVPDGEETEAWKERVPPEVAKTVVARMPA